ncbi:DegV family protein [Miniphocaeibacter massiliensis]|uniref:DegV family protein n=1 Tax=Miniphocaeibacter massiliensis TaxID=2041841 RepID=UPI000C06DF89|nr:DegV family protein [Miniphocaeibacter massiliensis]
MTLKIILDSGSDMPIEIAEKNDISILPLTVISNGVEYIDGLNLKPKELVSRMKNDEVFTTSQVSYEQFHIKFNQELDRGNEIVYLSLSGGISGCYASGMMAANDILEDNPNAPIYVINSKCASFAISLIALRASMMIKRGFKTKEIISKIHELCDNTDHYFTVDDMKYLYRGGRVTATQKILGGMLNIKPLLTVDKENGILIGIDKKRGLKQVYKKIIDLIKKNTQNNKVLGNQTIAVFHSGVEDYAIELKDILSNEIGYTDIILGDIGSTITAHTGPGCIVVFYSKNEIGEGLDTIEYKK